MSFGCSNFISGSHCSKIKTEIFPLACKSRRSSAHPCPLSSWSAGVRLYNVPGTETERVVVLRTDAKVAPDHISCC